MVKCEDGYSFRLSNDDSIYSDTASVTSSYKARIDSLFRDKRTSPRQDSASPSSARSLVTTVQVHNADPSPTEKKGTDAHNVTSIRVPSPQAWKARPPSAKEELENMFGGRDRRQRAFHDTRSAVQAQIEKLFADAAAEPAVLGGRPLAGSKPSPPFFNPPIPPPPPPPPLAVAPPPPPPPPLPPPNPPLVPPPEDSSDSPSEGPSLSSVSSSPVPARGETPPRRVVANMRYAVEYLGAIPLAPDCHSAGQTSEATSLEVLQEPLKELYYKYRYNVSRGRSPILGSLHITEKGLRIFHGTRNTPGHIDLFNPFSTVSVWVAVKLVIRREVGEHGQMFFSYAFLPLICDPDAPNKYILYHELNVGNPNIMDGEHPPMFACVMRKIRGPRLLECHGFVCHSADDAILIAANLYQSSLECMRAEQFSDSSGDPRDDRHVMSDSETVPIRPPRRKRSKQLPPSGSRYLKRSSSEDLLSSHVAPDENRVSKRRIKRSISDRHSLNTLSDLDDYTVVQIPRSKSFISVTSKYDFQDLLKDVKKQTGLNSVDDVLEQIINPKGMSFSEMDPKYRELLLKLALTLSKDEIYQRSKNIMRKQKYRTTSIASIIDSDSETSTISSVIKATKKSFSRLGSRASSLQIYAAKEKRAPKKLLMNKSRTNISEPMTKITENNSTIGDSLRQQATYESINKRVAPKTPMPKRIPKTISDGYVSCSECGYESGCSSKCYCSLPRQLQPRPSTLPTRKVFQRPEVDRVIPDLPCECDTESCAESEKCYCSLKGVRKTGLKAFEINIDSEDTDATVKSEITASCASAASESESSGSQRQRNSSPYLTEHSKSRSAGTVFSMHPDVIRKRSYSSNFSSDSDSSELRQERLSRASSRSRMSLLRQRSASTDYFSGKSSRLRRHPSGSVGSGVSSRDSQESPEFERGSNSSVGSLLDAGSHRSRGSSRSQPILMVSAVDLSGKLVYHGASPIKARQEGGSDTNSILSKKKTNEIAALFSEVNLTQTTELVNRLQCSASESEDDAYSSMRANSCSFLFPKNIETSLGYLP